MERVSEASCPFCQAAEGSQVVVEYGSVFAIIDKHPVTKGHHLVISKRHVADYFAMSYNEKSDAEALLSLLKRQILLDDPSVQGFNVGMNCGRIWSIPRPVITSPTMKMTIAVVFSVVSILPPPSGIL
jgi:diadenosine tetraphosphate (Ap4A) HIT family hydrolase